MEHHEHHRRALNELFYNQDGVAHEYSAATFEAFGPEDGGGGGGGGSSVSAGAVAPFFVEVPQHIKFSKVLNLQNFTYWSTVNGLWKHTAVTDPKL